MTWLPLAMLLAMLSCTRSPDGAARPEPEVAPPQDPSERGVRPETVHLELVPLRTTELRGISGLTVGPEGELWAAAERRRHLLPLRTVDGQVDLRGPPVPLGGVPDVDVESIVYLGGGRFYLGTEAHHSRSSDPVLLVTLDAGKNGEARVVPEGTIDFSYGPFSTSPRKNRGVEGACAVNATLVLANENVIERGQQRLAPVMTVELESNRATRYLLRLTSDRGKLAAIACRGLADGAIAAVAIERHYSILRLLRFDVGGIGHADPPTEITPAWVADLVTQLGSNFNPEGLAWLEDDTLWLINDNDTGGITGPTRLYRASVALP